MIRGFHEHWIGKNVTKTKPRLANVGVINVDIRRVILGENRIRHSTQDRVGDSIVDDGRGSRLIGSSHRVGVGENRRLINPYSHIDAVVGLAGNTECIIHQ